MSMLMKVKAPKPEVNICSDALRKSKKAIKPALNALFGKYFSTSADMSCCRPYP